MRAAIIQTRLLRNVQQTNVQNAIRVIHVQTPRLAVLRQQNALQTNARSAIRRTRVQIRRSAIPDVQRRSARSVTAHV